MKKSFRLWMLMVPLALGLASCETDNNHAFDPKDVINPETPEQQTFWQKFDAWQTDSCTVGDDFYMHMVGTWWKNPVSIYPKGVMEYADELNDRRENEIYQKNENLQLLKKHASENLTMDTEEVVKMVKDKVDQLWAGAATREEALAALGRAWAEGYTMFFEPVVKLINGVPTWQLNLKIPSYVDRQIITEKISELSLIKAPRPSATMRTRAEQELAADLAVVTKAMNIGVDCIEVEKDALETVKSMFEGTWKTANDIKAEIEQCVLMMDGVLVNDECVEKYNEYFTYMMNLMEVNKKKDLTRKDILGFVLTNMGGIYALNDYNRNYITPKVRQQYTDWCEQFRSTMRQRLEDNTWLESSTRQNAIEKLEKVLFFVGGIEVIPDCVVPTLTGKNIIEDVRQLRLMRMEGYRWAVKEPRNTCAQLLENLDFLSSPISDNASYMHSVNIVTINPSNLCEPYVQEDYEETLQWAFIGTTIGHELTHAFDRTGSQYDQWGNLKNWWAPNDTVKFTTLCKQLEEQYNKLQLMPWVDPSLCGNGKFTLSENIADLGGCCLALQALLSKHPNASNEEKRLLARRFFQGWAIQWSKTYDLDFLKLMLKLDNHSQARERTNGVVRNVNEWYEAYDIKSGTLFLPTSERVHIW